jgi:hypothetical protein
MVVLLTTSLTSTCRNTAEAGAKAVEAGRDGTASPGRRLLQLQKLM